MGTRRFAIVLVAVASGLACSPTAEPKQPAAAQTSSSAVAATVLPIAPTAPLASAQRGARSGDTCAVSGATSCAEGLECFHQALGQGVCAPPHLTSELLSDPDRYRGVLVSLSGVRVTQLTTCTDLACGAANPCCNRCSARAYVGSEPHLLGLSRADGSAFEATGTNCKLESEIGLGAGPYSMLGTLEVRAQGPAFRTKSIIAEPAR